MSTITSTPVQNVSGGNGATGLFFLNGWDSHPDAKLQYVRTGWTVVGQSGWVVSAVDKAVETITITGGTFVSGTVYQFTGPRPGLSLEGGMTITGRQTLG